MCQTVYIASDAVLPIIESNPDRPEFNVKPLQDYDMAARQTIEARNVVSAGSHTGCGCGFLREDDEPADDVNASRIALQRYLTEALALGPVDLYVCWNSDAPETWSDPILVPVDQLRDREDWLVEGTRVHVAPPFVH